MLASPRPHEAVAPWDVTRASKAPAGLGSEPSEGNPTARQHLPSTTQSMQRGEKRPNNPPTFSQTTVLFLVCSPHRSHTDLCPGTRVRAVPFQHQSYHHRFEAEAGCYFNTCLNTTASDHKGKVAAERDLCSSHVGGPHISYGVQQGCLINPGLPRVQPFCCLGLARAGRRGQSLRGAGRDASQPGTMRTAVRGGLQGARLSALASQCQAAELGRARSEAQPRHVLRSRHSAGIS